MPFDSAECFVLSSIHFKKPIDFLTESIRFLFFALDQSVLNLLLCFCVFFVC